MTREEILIEEYKVCHDKTTRIDFLIWTLASILFPLQVSAFSYFLLNKETLSNYNSTVLLVASISIYSALIWNRLSITWHTYQKIAYYRMREIEKELELFHYRYSLYFRNSYYLRNKLLEDENDKNKFIRLGEKITGSIMNGLSNSINKLTFLVCLSWIYLVLEALDFYLKK